ncbi:MAG TPA: putative Ig domain-containing protein [Pirellulales bacterium]
MINYFARLRQKNGRTRRRISRNLQPFAITSAASRPASRVIHIEALEDRRMLAIDFSMLAGDLQSTLSTLETNVSTAVNQAPSIPILGANLGNNPGLTQAIGSKANSLQSGFQAVASDIASHPGASDLVIAGFVKSELSSVATGIVVTPDINPDGTWRFQLQLHQDLATSSVHPQFDADLGSFFSLSSSGSIDLKVGMDYLLQFTFDPTTSAIALESTNLSTVDPTLPNAPLALEVSATPSAGFSINGTLAGLLHLSATDDGTQFTGTYGVNIASASQVNVSLTATAHLGLHASLEFGTGDLPFNPKITSDFHFDWSLASTTLTGSLSANTLGTMSDIGFDHVSIDVGSFFGSYLASLVTDIQHFTKPMQPIIDVINTPIPGLSDLGLNVTLRSLLGIEGSGYDDALDAITAIDNIDPSSLGGTGAIDLGSFTLTNDIRLNGPTINTSNVAGDIMQQAQTDAGSSLNQVGGDSASGFQFPVLTDPLHSVFAMLTGQDATLFSFKMPSLTVPLSIEIPILAIPPFAGLFADVSVAFSFDLSVGYDTHGLREFVADTASGADAGKLTDDILDGFYLDNSTNSAGHAATGFDITGGVSLAAKALIIKVSGGLFADVDLHLDPSLDDAQQRVRLGALADELGDGSDPFTASGSIFVEADLQIVIPAFVGDIVLADVQLAHITLVDFDSNDDSPLFATNNTIFIDKDSDNENIDVKMEQEDPASFDTGLSQFNVSGADPKAYVEAIVVSYPDHKESYPVGYFQHVNGNLVGEDLEEQTSDSLFTVFQPITNGTPDDGWTPIHYNLVATTPALDFLNDPEPETGNQTISVGNLMGDADGTPVNAVLIGGSGNDILEYQGAGKAVLIGGGGDDKLRAFNQQAQQVDGFGDDIDPNVFDVNNINFAMPDETRQQILAHVVAPGGSPAHTSNVLAGAGANVFLGGGTWDNFFEGGSVATYVGGAGQNEFRIEAKLADPNAPVIPGDIIAEPAADNTVIVDRTGLPASVADNVTLRAESDNIHITGYLTDITVSSAFTLAVDMDGGTLDIGDMSSLGPVHFLVNRGASANAPTKVLLDTPLTGLNDPLEISESGPVDPVANPNLFSLDVLQGPSGDQPGASLKMLGFTASDSLDVTLHGGQVNIGDIDGTGMGLVKIDGSVRPANSTAVDDISVTTHAENVTIAPDPLGNSVAQLENSVTPYDVEIDSHRAQDITTFIVPTQDKGNLATVDASQMKGTLHVEVGGATVKLLQVAANMTVIVAGTDPANPAEITVGDGKLSHIESNVSVEAAELTIDNSTNTAPHIFTLTANTFTGWTIPSSSFEPTVFLGNDLAPLVGSLTLLTAAGDQLDVEANPSQIDTLVIDNATATRNSIFVVAATHNIQINGDFNLYLGRRLNPDGTSVRLKSLAPISNVQIIFNFHTDDPDNNDGTETIFDGDLDPAGAAYSISGGLMDGAGKLNIENVTENLDVLIENYRANDLAYIYLPGGTVDANLTKTSPGTITIDGQARLVGTNPDAPNAISAKVRAGAITLSPTGTFDSVLQAGNTVNILGAKPQDTLNVTAPTTIALAPTSLGTPNTSLGLADQFDVFSPYVVANPPPDAFYIVNGASLTINSGPGPRPGLMDDDLLESLGVSFFDTTLTYQSTEHVDAMGHPLTATVNVREFFINTDPQATDNLVNFDASQLRGVFNFNVSEPDYSDAAKIANGGLSTGFDSEVDNALPVTSYGQTHVVLSNVNPELSVNISGTQAITGTEFNSTEIALDTINIQPKPPIVNVASTDVSIGNGVMANIQGNVSVHMAWLKDVDDRLGTTANNLTLGSTTYTGWATIAGTKPTLSMDTLQGELTVSGSALDQFDVEDTPNSAMKTTIENFTTDGTAPGVYLMGKTTAPLYVNGHFSVYAGRRLNADGTVTDVGKVDNLYNLADKFAVTGGIFSTAYDGSFLFDGQLQGLKTLSGLVDIVPGFTLDEWLSFTPPFNLSLPLFVNYVGAAQGTFTFDTSNAVVNGVGFTDGLESNSNFPGEADLRYRALGDVIYGANLEVFDYGPLLTGNSPLNIGRVGSPVVLNNPLPLPFNYVSNPNSVNGWEQIEVGATVGPVTIVGRDSFTRVDVDPTDSHSAASAFGTTGGLPGWGNVTGGNSLLTTLLGALTVSHVGLTIHANVAGSASPGTTPQVVVTDSQITGIAGATIHYGNLADGYAMITQFGSLSQVAQFPGLMIRMPTYGGGDVQFQNTPSGASTELDTLTNAIGNVTVQGTTGALSLGDLSHSASDEFYNFAAASVNIGGGSMLAINGNLFLGASYAVPLTTIDDSNDTTAPQMTLEDQSSFDNIALGGPSTGSIVFQFNIPTTSHFDIHGAANAQWSINDTQPNTQLFANTGSQVSVTRGKTSGRFPPMTVLGAGSILMDGQDGVNLTSSAQFKVAADPARPTDVTNLTVNLSNTFQDNLKIDTAGSGFFSFFTNNGTAQPITYQGNTTHLTYITDFPGLNDRTVTVADSGSAGTTISGGRISVSVLGTDGPLEIDQGNGGPVTLGNGGSLQGIHGAVTVVASNAALPVLPIIIDDSADTTNAIVTLGSNGAGNTQISGLTSSPIQLTGNSVAITLKGGTGSNTLVGPDSANNWQLTGANAGVLNSAFTYSKFANLKGGSGTDDFFFTSTSGTVSGNVDAGAGFDTAHYSLGVLNGTETINIAAGILPKISGSATNFEAVDVQTHVGVVTPANQASGKAHPITPLAIQVTGGGGTRTFSATGLPTGLTIDPQSGIISGTVASTVADNTVFNTKVTVSDTTGTASASFTWTIVSDFGLVNPSSQVSSFFNNANLAIGFNNNFGTNVTFSAQNLPPGLSINPQTGVISGTYLPGTVSPIVAPVTVSATDGVHTTQVNFTWTVSDSAGTKHADLAGTDGGVISFVSSGGAQLKASYFDPTSMGAPAAGYLFPLGGIKLEVDGLHAGDDAEITITPPHGVNLDELLADSSSVWINLLGRSGNVSAHISGGSIVVDLVDGEIGEYTPAFDGTISAYLVPGVQQLTAAIGNAPAQVSPGQAVTLSSDLAGTLAPSAESTWQATLNGSVVQTATGASFNFAPQQSGAYNITLTASDLITGVSATAQTSIVAASSVGALNAGTPAGTPFLAGLVDPSHNEGIETITPVTFSNLAGAPALTYFTTLDPQIDAGDAWQYNGSGVAPVMIQGTNQQLTGIGTTIGTTIDVDGRWVAMVDPSLGNIWAVTPEGARLIVSAANGLNPIDNLAAVGDTLYFSARDSVAQNQLRSVRLDATGNPVITQVTNLFDETGNNFFAMRALTPFAGGLAFIATVGPYEEGLEPSDEVFLLTAGATPVVKEIAIDAAQNFPNISSLSVIEGPGGTSRLIFTRAGDNSPASLYSLDSSDAGDANPTATKIDIAPAEANVEIGDLTAVGSKVYFTTNANELSTSQLWVSDGTAGGTQALTTDGQPDDQRPFSLVNVGGQLNFLSSDDEGEVNLWTIDSVSGQPVKVSDLGQQAQLSSVGGRLYAEIYDATTGHYQLWSGAGGASQLTQVPSNPNNPYTDPGVIAADDQGVVYFSGGSTAVQDSFGDPTNQLWVLGPAFANAGGTATALNIVTPADTFAGTSPTVTISATTVAGDPAADFAGPVSVQVDDGSGNTVFTTSGNFSGGVYSFQLPQLATAGSVATTYTLHVVSNDLSTQASFTVHPIVHFGPTSSTTVVAGAGQTFSLSMQADDDRQLFAAGYTGQVTLSYTDGGGTHQLGPVSAVQGIVTFTGLTLPTPGSYTFTATSIDGTATGSFVVTVPKAIQFTTTTSEVSDTDVFDLDIVAADVAGNPAAGYTGLVLATLTDPNGVSTNTSYYVGPDQQSHLVLKGLTLPIDGQYQLRLSDGIVASTLTINVSPKQVVPGDLNDDGKVDATDIDTLFGFIATGNTHGDLNNDGKVDKSDLDFLIHNILHTEYGDANLDGFVDTSDLAIVRTKTGSTLSGPDWASGDFNGDGFVDVADLAVVRSHMGFASTVSSTTGATSPSSPLVQLTIVASPTTAPAAAPAMAITPTAAVGETPAATGAQTISQAGAVSNPLASPTIADPVDTLGTPPTATPVTPSAIARFVGPLLPRFLKTVTSATPAQGPAINATAEPAEGSSTSAPDRTVVLGPLPFAQSSARTSVLTATTAIDAGALHQVLAATVAQRPSADLAFDDSFEELINLLATNQSSAASGKKN